MHRGPSFVFPSFASIILGTVLFAVLGLNIVLPSALRAQDQHYFDSLHAAYAYASTDTDRSDILMKLANSLEDADTATAMSYAMQAYQLAEKAGDKKREARFDLFQAHAFSSKGLYDSARTNLLALVTVAEALPDSELLAQAYSQLGWNDLEVASYSEALDYFVSDLNIVTARRDTAGIAVANDNLGLLYLDQQEPEEALKYLRQALTFAELGHNARTLAAIYNNIGLSFNGPLHSLPFDKRLDSALYYFRKSADLYSSVDEHYQLARVLGNIGNVFEKKGVLDSTLYYDRHSVWMHESAGISSTYEAEAYAQLGNVFVPLHKFDSAFFYLNHAKAIDEQIDARRGLVDIYFKLGNAYDSSGDFKKAFEFLTKGVALHDSIYSVDKSRILADMEAKYQTSKNERRIAAQNEELSHERFIIYSVIGLVVVLILVVGIFYRNERKLAKFNKELEAAKERAEASERLEHQFLANMSHEIRTPMNAVLGMTNLLLDTSLTQKQRDYLEAIQASAENLLVVINDILDLSKLQAGKMEFEKIPFRLREVTGHALEIMRFKADAKGIQLEEEISENAPQVIVGDSVRLSQIVMNLLSNAVKFTEHGSVKLIATAHAIGENKMGVRVAVRDTGIGIPSDKIRSIFDSFSQAETETTRKYGGTGLGLTISRTLAELQGGKIDVMSEFGKGSEFAVTIPYEVAPEEVLSVAAEAPAEWNAEMLSGIRVLLVEDNEYNQIVLSDTVRNMVPDVALEIASNGREAITLLQNFAFDLVLMDVQMPEMDGIEATKYIRAHLPRGKREVPIVALTASVIKTEIDKCFAAGMNDYVPKPFKQDELFSVIAKYYKGRPKPSVPKVQEPIPTNGQIPMNGQSESNPSSATPVTDLSSLREITGGSDEQMKKYVRMFVDGVPSQLDAVATALAASDLDGARRRVHAMKPQLKFMGMTTAAGFAESIERLCEEKKNPSEVNEKFSQVRAQCEQAIVELRQKL